MIIIIVALKFYEVKGFGFAEVEQLYGIETMRNAAEQLKHLYEGKGKMKLRLFISVKGVRLYDQITMVSIISQYHYYNNFLQIHGACIGILYMSMYRR